MRRKLFFNLLICITVITVWGCGPDPIQQLKNNFNSMIRDLEDVRTEGDTVSDNEAFFKCCRGILEEFRDSEYAVDRLKDLLLTSEFFTVRGGAALVLGQLGSINDALPLINALGDANLFVKEKAAKALKEISHEEFGMDQKKWMDWWNTKEKENGE